VETRKNIRLKGYDYSQGGVYFVTVSTKDRKSILWESGVPVGADIIRPNAEERSAVPLSAAGRIADQAIRNIPGIYDGVRVERYVVMPNHVHMLITIENGRMVSAPTISTIVGGMKRWASRQFGSPLWQKSFYDHIIRDETDFLTRWHYIDTNPARWLQKEEDL